MSRLLEGGPLVTEFRVQLRSEANSTGVWFLVFWFSGMAKGSFSQRDRFTRLLFCTTGVLLNRLNASPELEGPLEQSKKLWRAWVFAQSERCASICPTLRAMNAEYVSPWDATLKQWSAFWIGLPPRPVLLLPDRTWFGPS